MSPFARLHPAVQHHIVNSLGWRSLRPTQEQAILPVLEGYHALLLAPTAGGKTEAAVFPVLSRMLDEHWHGLSVLYVCPIKALLNNLLPRLERYLGLVGRRVGLWHGDVGESARRRLRSDPPDLLLTTPESIEAMLISSRTDPRCLFDGLRVIIVDELHAFAGDDRGWHLLLVLERLDRLVGRQMQRLGLSATVGNPDDLLSWLARDLAPGRAVIGSGRPGGDKPDVLIDPVGSLENAAHVLSRLHRGEKRLVFADARSKVEALAVALRQKGVNTFVSHSALSQEARRQAEAAFAESSDCVIVATSTLELGLDVGDLDHVVQIDAPTSVSSFLQRMGRTGRRSGTRRNCLFLTTDQESFLFAGAIVRLWLEGFVEPVVPPATPWHLFAQQVMALALQEGGVARRDWRGWIGDLPIFNHDQAGGADGPGDAILAFMVAETIMHDDGGILWLGQRGETVFGRRHFSDIVTSFTVPLFLSVVHGRTEIGQIDPVTLQNRSVGFSDFSLGGRSWTPTHIDWSTRRCWVEPAGDPARARWLGSARAAHFALCQAVAGFIADGLAPSHLSRRGIALHEGLGESFTWCRPGRTSLVRDRDGRFRWWTFAGTKANAMLAAAISDSGLANPKSDNLSIGLGTDMPGDLLERLGELPTPRRVPVPERLVSELKFNECLPDEIATAVVENRQADQIGMEAVLSMPIDRVMDAT